ncbi:hypothetical protein CONPUDRAFT_166492 [Coniophora puteana RWD-64-598 SS2]|uniref:Uncharacterized protein n=1 Tax=Coniophora puteana (strain RWD-64-598) TaxID=741705 RepID=A0A5M3MKM9_CONPW|nr:uncharacterized protein CONPUDRAFT_166492 [Coniophora puteana RWD-64-598 SS2]EIW79789.1 hypothetical protein CONPUDRAFT_166492 [Coniophora puteana RWD-64-598 SS2]
MVSGLVSAFKELKWDDNNNLPKLAPLAIVQGSIFTFACAIEALGLAGSIMQNVRLIRFYALGSSLSAVAVVAVGFMRTITHWTFKGDIIEECVQVVSAGDSDTTVFGIWGQSYDYSGDNPQDFCNSQWTRDSWAEIITLLAEIVVGILFTALAFAYWRQLRDPQSPANSFRAPSSQARADAYPTYYSPPYNGPEMPYQPSYAPPPGPPPHVDADSKPPGYDLAGGDYMHQDDKKGDDPFADFDGPSVPRPTHWVDPSEERDVTSSGFPLHSAR